MARYCIVGGAGFIGNHFCDRLIADLACEVIGLDPAKVVYEYTGGDRGWKGDVPVVKLDSSRIRALGWPGARPTRESLRLSLQALNSEAARGLI